MRSDIIEIYIQRGDKGMVDLVVPYVDFSDPAWIKTAKDNGIDYSEINRFRGQGEFFRYFFRSIAKNMPWINNLFFIVQSETQIPKWLDRRKIRVVLHEDFIPKEFLPLYNSCTIEMFLGNIKGLSEKFLYFNDDMYILKSLKEEDFFENGKVKMEFDQKPTTEPFKSHCENSYKLIFDGEMESAPWHHVKPLFKSKVLECFNKYKNEMYKSISKLRETKNMNAYIYSFYLLKEGLVENSTLSFGYAVKYDSDMLLGLNRKDMLCVADFYMKFNIYDDKRLNKKFRTKFPDKCKYELGGK